MPKSATIRTLIVDDHRIFRESLHDALKNQPDIDVIGTACDAKNALLQVQQLAPDVVLMDIEMPEISGIEATRRIREDCPSAKIIIFSVWEDKAVVLSALRAGAQAYLNKSALLDELIETIRSVNSGKYYCEHFPRATLDHIDEVIKKENTNVSYSHAEIYKVIAEIVGIYCHDLGNDLGLLLSHCDDGNINGLKRNCIAATRTLKDLHRFIRQFYSLDEGRDVQLKIEEIRTMLKEIFLPVLKEKNITFKIDLSKADSRLRVPKDLLRPLIYPLINNAMEALSQQKRKRAKCISVKFSTMLQDNIMSIVVSDNGQGWGGRLAHMEAAMLKGHRRSTKGRSRGYGLQNVYRLVFKLGGAIKLAENPVGGATVNILLPWRIS